MTSAKKITEQDEKQAAGKGEVSETAEKNGPKLVEKKTPAEATKPKEPDQKVKQVSTGKRPLGTKEVIPFQWKLVGVSDGMALTLFKAVEREDVEAQSERSQREGYYTDLRILDVDEKVVQPKPPKPPARRRAKKAKRPPAKAAKRKRPAKVRSAVRLTAKKGTKKAPAKAAKKKKAPAKSTKKKAKKRKR